jgi:hypothetical protein
VSDCINPCECLGPYYYFERTTGKCMPLSPIITTCEKKKPEGDEPPGDSSGSGYVCNGIGGTWVGYCSNAEDSPNGPYVEACANYYGLYDWDEIFGEEGSPGCEKICGQAGMHCNSEIDRTIMIPGYGSCCEPVLIPGFSGIFTEPEEPHPCGPYPGYGWDLCLDTCGGFPVLFVVARSINGPVYIGWYSRRYYLSPFFSIPNTISSEVLIYTRPDININGTGTCYTCGVPGKPDCMLYEDLAPPAPRCPGEE